MSPSLLLANMSSPQNRDETPPLGTCPGCGEPIAASNLLIKYETDEGWPRMFAECPDCEEPVHPR